MTIDNFPRRGWEFGNPVITIKSPTISGLHRIYSIPTGNIYCVSSDSVHFEPTPHISVSAWFLGKDLPK